MSRPSRVTLLTVAVIVLALALIAVIAAGALRSDPAPATGPGTTPVRVGVVSVEGAGCSIVVTDSEGGRWAAPFIGGELVKVPPESVGATGCRPAPAQ